jgi:hypothetical protein
MDVIAGDGLVTDRCACDREKSGTPCGKAAVSVANADPADTMRHAQRSKPAKNRMKKLLGFSLERPMEVLFYQSI